MTVPKEQQILIGHRPANEAVIFGDGSLLDDNLVEQLGNRGTKASVITVPVGWPNGVELAIVRLDTEAGEDALRDLATQELPATRAICTRQNPQSLNVARAIRDACVECSDRNLVTLLWHPAVGMASPDIRPDDLAFVVVRELVNFGRPHFLEQSVVLDEIDRAD
ncbi:MAG: hypothetical protein H7288_02600 [Kineosporiaceae bacterium]|nr:hypothetical protein [Aeromicrobium sp.]